MRKILDDMQIRTVATNDPVVHNNMEFFSTFFANKERGSSKEKIRYEFEFIPYEKKNLGSHKPSYIAICCTKVYFCETTEEHIILHKNDTIIV